MTDRISLTPSRHLKKRYRAEKRFKACCIGALVLAMAFLVLFFTDMIRQGYSAFYETQIRAEVTYNEDTVEFAMDSVSEEVFPLVSRAFFRGVPRQVENNPDLMDTTQTQWLTAKADVDQYLKGHSESLDPEMKASLEQLQADGDVGYGFNTGLFFSGDSKIPSNAGLWSAFVGTFYLMLVVLAISFPIGVATAIYLEEFAPDNRFTQAIEININNLAAVPSILFGLLGLAIFINFFGVPRSSALAGGLTLSLMTLPVIIISTRAALKAVPQNIRQGAQAVGASRWQAVRDHVLPLALPGILTGTIIGIAQAIGETAPLLLIGMIAYIPDAPGNLTDAATVLPAQIFTWAGMPERAYVSLTAAGILVLLSLLIVLNATAVILRNRFERRW
ncbi:phosphate ABC transporter permease PstA [Salinisphaera orenii]|uniref:Phosphate transport system permease protein PstA n=1 Tax=Salinisphaera orenii YIM 95161 TaxID=1051139 RepID=A0A423PED1_9GAMM|nr:phosphate ABC transporter permease PstA [Salinisphaera halophila]ROO23916.1 phosphate ABC transporter permease [Salinisphaera halophila YIM 95161]